LRDSGTLGDSAGFCVPHTKKVFGHHTHVSILKLPEKNESGLRFKFSGTQETLLDPAGFSVPLKNHFFGTIHMIRWSNCLKITNLKSNLTYFLTFLITNETISYF
jgi:hypothetical protein